MPIRLAVFDLDGTILDTLGDLAGALNFALGKFSFPQRTLPEVRSFVGNGIKVLIERACPEGTVEEARSLIHESFSSYYKDHCADRTSPYDGIVDLVKRLHDGGMKTAVVSNKPDYAVQILCKKFFDGLFDFVSGEKPPLRRKPFPDTVFSAMEKTGGIKPEETVYVGDSEVDYLTSQNAGTKCVLVSWGFRDKSSLLAVAEDVKIADTVPELEKILCRNLQTGRID